jgi:hypothetical protein
VRSKVPNPCNPTAVRFCYASTDSGAFLTHKIIFCKTLIFNKLFLLNLPV